MALSNIRMIAAARCIALSMTASAQPQLVKDLGPVVYGNVNPSPGSNPTGFVSNGSLLFFNVRTGGQATAGVWRTDGTAAGTFPLLTIASLFPDTGVTLINNETAVFGGFVDGHDGVWRTDGTVAETAMVEFSDRKLAAHDAGEGAVDSLRGAGLCFEATDLSPQHSGAGAFKAKSE